MSDFIQIYRPADESWRPCPFCGNSIDLETMEFYNEVKSHSDTNDAIVHVKCPKCSLEMNDYPSDHEEKLDYYQRVEFLHQKWNRRMMA